MQIDKCYIFENIKEKRIWGFTHFTCLTDMDLKNEELSNKFIFNEICFRYAGLVAEKIYFKLISGSDKVPMFFKNGTEDDIAMASSIIKKYNLAPPGRKRYTYKKRLMKKKSIDLKSNWDDVMLIAHALFDKKKLNFVEIKDILTKKSKNKEFWKIQFKEIINLFNDKIPLDERDLSNKLL